jgi:outer membrane receptor for ferrienterochelin and colicin
MKYFIISIVMLITISSFALASNLKGTVYGIDAENKSMPLKSATVTWMGSSNGTLTGADGSFNIQRDKKSDKLIVSYTGYSKDTVSVAQSETYIDVKLKSSLMLDNVIVEAQQPATIVSKSTIKSETITIRGLQKAACCNLSESFQTNPSVDVSYSDAVTGAKQIQLLGLQGAYIQMLTEKVPTMRGLSSNFGLDYVPGPFMESIQISKGAASVATGYESMSGQINVEYKKPMHSEPLFLNFYANHLGRYEGNATSAIQISDRLSTMLMAHASVNQKKLDLNADGYLDKPLTEQYNIINRWVYFNDIWESQTLFKGIYEDRKGGQLAFYPNSDTNYYGMDIKTQKYEFYTKNGFVFPTKHYSSLGTIVSASHYELNSFFNKSIYKAEQNSIYLNLIYQADLPMDTTHKYVVGLSFMNDNYIERTKTAYEPKYETVPGAYLEYTYVGIPNLTLMGGIRADFPKGKSIFNKVYSDNEFKLFITPRFHLQYKFDENSTVRASAGKGYRIANMRAENLAMLATSRKMVMDKVDRIRPEEAWNYGINASTSFELFDRTFTFNSEFYRTDFINQLVVDMERNPNEVYYYNLRGKSYSNSFQIDMNFDPFDGLTATLAYRLNDVKMTINGELLDKPLQSRNKSFINLSYATNDDSWNIDFTTEFNGSGRLPNTDSNIVQYRLPKTFDAFYLLHAQITKKFKNFDIYLGGENLTNFTQKNPILAADQMVSSKDFKYFDSSIIWGPVIGRTIYLGFRYTLN